MIMTEISRDRWKDLLMPFDLILIKGKTLFGKLQAIEAKQDGNKDYLASHSAMLMRDGWTLFEADGLKGVIGRYTLDRYLTDHHQIWVWRFPSATNEQLKELNDYQEIILGAGVEYGWSGIMQFVKKAAYHVIGKTYNPKEKRGMFCSETTSQAILRANLPYTAMATEDISPSEQREWMETTGRILCWRNPLIYDKGKYLLTMGV